MKRLLLTVCACLFAVPASAQTAGNSEAVPAASLDMMRTMLREAFTQVNDLVRKSAELVPADRYVYQPVSTVRTFGQLVAHLADSYAYYCGVANGTNPQWSDAIEKGRTDKTTMLQQLDRAAATCTAAYTTGSDVRSLGENVTHTNLHYGNIITYMRMLGLVPPSS